MSTCTGLAALDYANTKFLRGYATTGVAMGICARHEFVQPNGVGDLQKGERCVNLPYVLHSILHDVLKVCQHGLHRRIHAAPYPSAVAEDLFLRHRLSVVEAPQGTAGVAATPCA